MDERYRFIVGFLACAVAGCSAASWKSPLGRNHPLTGRIWDVEVDKQMTEPQSYALPHTDSRWPFDYVWFTPRVDDKDPCEKFKSQFDRMKKSR